MADEATTGAENPLRVTDAMIEAAIKVAQEYGLEDELASRLMWREILQRALETAWVRHNDIRQVEVFQ